MRQSGGTRRMLFQTLSVETLDPIKPFIIMEQSHILLKRQLLLQVQERIRAVKEELRSLQEYEEALELDLDDLENRLESPIIPPIMRLPPEILSDIFATILQLYPDLSRHTISDPSILKLMLACKTWHQLIIDTPQLWTTIGIVSPHEDHGFSRSSEPPIQRAKRQIAQLEDFLARSRGLPLKIYIDFRSLDSAHESVVSRLEKAFESILDDDEFSTNFAIQWTGPAMDICRGKYNAIFESLIQTLVGTDGSNIARCRRLSVYFPSDNELASIIFSLVNQPAPLLTHIDLLKPHSDMDDDLFTGERLQLPSVTWMSLNRFSLEVAPFCPNLVELEIKTSINTAKIGLLNDLRFLKRLRIFYQGNEIAIPSITLPGLQELEFLFHVPVSLAQAFHTPNLRRLVMSFVWYSDASVFPQLDLLSSVPEVYYAAIIRREYDAVKSNMGILFNQLTRTQVIGVSKDLLEMTLEMVRNHKAKGRLQALRTLITLDGNAAPIGPSYNLANEIEMGIST